MHEKSFIGSGTGVVLQTFGMFALETSSFDLGSFVDNKIKVMVTKVFVSGRATYMNFDCSLSGVVTLETANFYAYQTPPLVVSLAIYCTHGVCCY